MNKIKVAFIVSTLSFGGIEKYVIDIVNNLNQQKFSSYILCLSQHGPIIKYLENKKVNVFIMDKKTGNDFTLPKRIAKIIKNEGIDIIHANNWGTFGESVIAKKFSGSSKIIYVQHGMEQNDIEFSSYHKRQLRNRFRRFFSQFVDQIVTVSAAGERFISNEWKVPRRNIKLIYNGVKIPDLLRIKELRNKKRSELGLLENDFVIGSVGRLSRVKNYSCLINAFSCIANQIDNAKLVLVGDGPQNNFLRSLAKDLNIQPKVRFMGNRTDIIPFLSAMDVFSLSSVSEGISLSILEAMATKLPIAVTNVGGNREIIKNGKTGILVESGDSKALANEIIRLYKNPEERIKIGIAARKLIEKKFNLHQMISDYEELYTSVVSKNYLN